MEIPASVGLMVLPNAVLFPQSLVPLYIFEPRYQLMLARALETDRLFALALPGPDLLPRPIGCIGLIRASVHNPDGTSHLILQGMTRVRFTSYTQTHPYFIARIERVNSVVQDAQLDERLGKRLVELVLKSRLCADNVPDWIAKCLQELDDPGAVADLVTATFIDDACTKQQILEDPYTTSRIQRALLAIQAQLGAAET